MILSHLRLPLMIAMLTGTAACEPAATPADLGESDKGDENDRFAADMRFFEGRRRAFMEHGEIPTVPASLSENPNDPEYRFLGYMRVATAEEARSHAEPLATHQPEPMTPEEEASLERPLHGQELAGVYVNAAGEKWGYAPRDLEQRLAARRATRGDVAARVASSNSGIGVAEPNDEAMVLAPRNLIDGDNRIMRSADNGFTMTSYPWRTFGALVSDGSSTSGAPPVACSATKIGERHLLTAAHCVFSEGGGEASLVRRDWWPGADGIDFTMNSGDPSPNDYKNIQWYYYDSYYVDSGWDSRDFAVLVLYDNTNSCGLGWLGYREDYSLAGSWMWNFGYPGNNNDCDASPRGDSNCGGSMYGMEERITRTEVPYLFFKHDVQPGQSGSAIYDYNDGARQLVGIVKSDYSAVENRGIKIRDLVFDFIESARADQPSAYCD
jgi:V8-like Glu-specific endopeptidase